jgi:1,5-anhydro-D-fructose reductase (1,5-anhydro-D-mannitol-forming)
MDSLEGVTVYQSIEELVANPAIDAVYITSANGSHAADTIAALSAGKHVLVEKPIAARVEEGVAMLAEAKRTRLVLNVGHMLRHSRALQHARRLVQSGAIGKVRLATAIFGYEIAGTARKWADDPVVAGGGALIDAGIHAIDAIRFVTGQSVTNQAAICVPAPPRVETNAAVSLELDGGATAAISVCSDSDYMTELVIVGTAGRVTVPSFASCRGTVTVHLATPHRSEASQLNVADTYVRQLRSFCRAVITNSRSLASVQNGLENLKIVDGSYASAHRAGR